MTSKLSKDGIVKDWFRGHLEDFMETVIDYRGKAPNKSSNGVQLITARNVKDGYLDLEESREYVSSSSYQEWMSRGLPLGGDILFTTEAPLGNVAIYPFGGCYALAQRIICLRPKSNVLNNKFLAQMLRASHCRRELEKLSTGSTALGISQAALRKLPLSIPPISEQKKISSILETWDTTIERVTSLVSLKERRKRALMQQLLTGKRRFPSYQAEWRHARMIDVFLPVNRAVSANVEAVLSISSRKGFERQEKKFNKVIAGKNLEKYILLRKGEFAYNKGNSKTYPQGCIFRLDDYEEAGVPNVYFCFRIKDSTQMDSSFVRYYFEAGLLNAGLRSLINTGVRNNGLLNIYEKDFYGLQIAYPEPEEQRKIAAVLNACDEELQLLRAQVEHLKQQKKGLMQMLLTGQVRVPTRAERE